MTSWLDFFLGLASAYSPCLLAFCWVWFTTDHEPKRGRSSEPELFEAKGQVVHLEDWRRHA